jgi:hypothetical protein
VVGQSLRRVLARERLAGLLEHVGRYGLDVAAQLLAVAAHEVDALLGGAELEAVLLGGRLHPLLEASDLVVVALDQRAQLDLAYGRGVHDLRLACNQGSAVVAHERPHDRRAERDSEEKEDKTHRHHRVLIRERLTVAPRPDAMYVVRHAVHPMGRALRGASDTNGGLSPCGFAGDSCSRLRACRGLPRASARSRAVSHASFGPPVRGPVSTRTPAGIGNPHETASLRNGLAIK